MTRRGLILLAAVLICAGSVAAVRGRTVPGSLWLDGDPDPNASRVAVFVWGGACDGGEEEIRSLEIEETDEAVLVELTVRAPIGVGAPCGASYEGMPYVLELESPVGNRPIVTISADSSTTPVRSSPFSG